MNDDSAINRRNGIRRMRSIWSRKRFQLGGALCISALLPWIGRALFTGTFFEPPAANALLANAVAVLIVFWARQTIEIYPGIRRSYVILPATFTGHGLVALWFMLSRLPYDRVTLIAGFFLHVLWLYSLYIHSDRRSVTRIAVVPFGGVEHLLQIPSVVWLSMKRPILEDTIHCEAIVADFSADLPDEWEAFLADAALAGRVVYQHKQLMESLTGRVEIEHLSENSFGSLVPVRGYFYLKAVADFVFAIALLPAALPLMAAVAVAIRIDSKGKALFRQKRIGHAGKRITVYKFRTMRTSPVDDERQAAMTASDDYRITRVGRFLRLSRIDELPQIFNILKWEMSWIGPRPEAEVLSVWYTKEIPFYRYRHVVKPGISGWAQINQGHVAEVDLVHQKLQYDFYYIKYFSPWLDSLILFRTIATMLTGFGAR